MELKTTRTLELLIFLPYLLYSLKINVGARIQTPIMRLESPLSNIIPNQKLTVLTLLIDFFILTHLVFWLCREYKFANDFVSKYNILKLVIFTIFAFYLLDTNSSDSSILQGSSLYRHLINLKVLLGLIGNIVLFYLFFSFLNKEKLVIQKDRLVAFSFLFFGSFIWTTVLGKGFLYSFISFKACFSSCLMKILIYFVVWISMIISLKESDSQFSTRLCYGFLLFFVFGLFGLLYLLFVQFYAIIKITKDKIKGIFIPLLAFLAAGISMLQSSVLLGGSFCEDKMNMLGTGILGNEIIFSMWYIFTGLFTLKTIKKMLSKKVGDRERLSENLRMNANVNGSLNNSGEVKEIDSGVNDSNIKGDLVNENEKDNNTLFSFWGKYEGNTLWKNGWIYYSMIYLMNQIVFSAVNRYSFFLLHKGESVQILLKLLASTVTGIIIFHSILNGMKNK